MVKTKYDELNRSILHMLLSPVDNSQKNSVLYGSEFFYYLALLKLNVDFQTELIEVEGERLLESFGRAIEE